MKYYIAYGSNLNTSQMKRRCKEASLIGVSKLEGYRLLFCKSKTGNYLTVKKKEGRYVPVGIWKISEENEDSLDYFEGIEDKWYNKEEWKITVIKSYDSNVKNGEEIDAIIYVMPEDRVCGKPSKDYLERCKEGYNDFGFDTAILDIAKEESIEEA